MSGDFESNGHFWVFIQDGQSVTHWCRRCGALRDAFGSVVAFRVPGSMGERMEEPECSFPGPDFRPGGTD